MFGRITEQSRWQLLKVNFRVGRLLFWLLLHDIVVVLIVIRICLLIGVGHLHHFAVKAEHFLIDVLTLVLGQFRLVILAALLLGHYNEVGVNLGSVPLLHNFRYLDQLLHRHLNFLGLASLVCLYHCISLLLEVVARVLLYDELSVAAANLNIPLQPRLLLGLRLWLLLGQLLLDLLVLHPRRAVVVAEDL